MTSVYWSPTAWSDDDTGAAQRTPNLAAYVQNIVNDANWTSGNAVAVKIEGTGVSLTSTTATRKAESAEGVAAPVLHVEYTMSTAVLSTDNFEQFSYNVYPNPIEDILYLNLSDSNDSYLIQLFSLTGAMVLETNVKENQVNVNHLRKGVYLVNVLNSKGVVVFTNKIVKK